MAGLVPANHAFLATSAGMTKERAIPDISLREIPE
jgi:hypothetical protein